MRATLSGAARCSLPVLRVRVLLPVHVSIKFELLLIILQTVSHECHSGEVVRRRVEQLGVFRWVLTGKTSRNRREPVREYSVRLGVCVKICSFTFVHMFAVFVEVISCWYQLDG